LTADQLRQLIKGLPQKYNFNDYGSLVVCILSYGNCKGVVLGVDWKPVRIRDELINSINGKTCPQLKGKPEVWITQACQLDVIPVGIKIINFFKKWSNVNRLKKSECKNLIVLLSKA